MRSQGIGGKMFNRDEMMQQMADLREDLDDDELDIGTHERRLSKMSQA